MSSRITYKEKALLGWLEIFHDSRMPVVWPVTAETETIKASISGDRWNRQMVLTQTRDLYVQALRIL